MCLNSAQVQKREINDVDLVGVSGKIFLPLVRKKDLVMDIEKIEGEIIVCIRKNIEDSDEVAPELTPTTGVFTSIPNFDSLRAIEVLIGLEEVFQLELPPGEVFAKQPPGTDTVCDMAKAIKRLVDE